jgi:hypothetical protein
MTELMTVSTPLSGSLTEWNRPATSEEITAQVQLIQRVLDAVMIDGVHYGTIPGTDKPTLFKAGSEKVLMTFRIGVDPVVEDLSEGETFRYRVLARMIHQASGLYLGAGVGEASSDETKYKWRAAICEEEFDSTPVDHRRILWKKDRGDVTQIQQVRTNPADLANTVLKMAKKRAQIDGTLTVTAASDVFAQDLEDLADVADLEKATQTSKDEVTTKIVNVTETSSKPDAAKAWTKYTFKCADGKSYNTFDADLKKEFPKGSEVTIKFKVSQYGRDIVEMRKPAGPPPAGEPKKDAQPAAGETKGEPEPTGDRVFVSDVFKAGQARGWDAKRTGEFIKTKFGKEITALERGAECAAAIKAISDEGAES